ncbi:MAG: hypothetical protein LBG29_06970 [Synergistaceae bacterium]|nr:hypothetical protein [Synergistaceae bacterium]
MRNSHGGASRDGKSRDGGSVRLRDGNGSAGKSVFYSPDEYKVEGPERRKAEANIGVTREVYESSHI